MTSSRRTFAALVAAVALLGVAVPAGAQVTYSTPTAAELETARSLYKEGKELRARGDLAGALEKLQAAQALGNTPLTGIELARTYVLVGKLVEAREVCLYIARVPVAVDETERSVQARSDASHLAEELRTRIPTLRIILEGMKLGELAHLSIDGTVVPDVAIGQPQKVDPGKHDVVVRVGEGAAAREVHGDKMVREGEPGELTLTVPAAVAPPPPPARKLEPAAPPRSGPGPTVAKVGLVTALAGATVGIIAGLGAWTKTGQLAGECNPSKQCGPQNGGASDLGTARTWATVSSAAFAIGGVGAVAGVVGLLMGKGEPAKREEAGISPWIGAGAAGIDGRF